MSLADSLQSAKGNLNKLGALRHHPSRPLRLPVRYGSGMSIAGSPSISLVTPSLNQAPYLEKTIESVLAQGYPALEYVLQDGGSEDGSRAVIEAHAARLHAWESTPDDGQANALNRGFERTSGEVMGYLNGDDLLLPGALLYVGDYFARHPSVDVVYGHRVLIDEQGMEIGRQILPRHDDEVLSWGDFVPQETLFWRRSAWEAAGGYIDESFECAMDWDLLVRLRDAGAQMVRLPRFLGAFRVHVEQKTSQLGETVATAEMERIRRRIHGREVSQREVLRRIRPYLLRHVALDRLYRIGLVRY